MSDRPATEPRTEVPRCRYVCGLSERVHDDARTNHPFMAEAAQGAAPHDEDEFQRGYRLGNRDGYEAGKLEGAAPRAEGHCEHPQSEHGIFGCAMPGCPCETPHGRAAPRAEGLDDHQPYADNMGGVYCGSDGCRWAVDDRGEPWPDNAGHGGPFLEYHRRLSRPSDESCTRFRHDEHCADRHWDR